MPKIRRLLIVLPVVAVVVCGRCSVRAQDNGTPDTVRIQSITQVAIPSTFTTRVAIMSDAALNATAINLAWDHEGVELDSGSFVGTMMGSWATKGFNTGLIAQRKILAFTASIFEPDVPPGINNDSLFCTLYFSVSPSAVSGDMNIDTLLFPPDNTLLLSAPSAPGGIVPKVVTGKIGIGQDYVAVTEFTAGGNIPENYTLGQNYPNPFNAGTVIQYDLPRDGNVNLEVFNILGQKVATLVDGFRSLGQQSVSWDGTDDRGNEIATGIYFYRLRTDGYTSTRKMVVLR